MKQITMSSMVGRAQVTDRDARVLERARVALTLLFGPTTERSFTVRFWNGVVDGPSNNPPEFALVLHSPGALRTMFLPPSELRIAEAYVHGIFDIEGNLEAAVQIGQRLADRLAEPLHLARVVAYLLRLPSTSTAARTMTPTRRSGWWMRLHSRARDAKAVRAHYDVGNEFYELWLDARLVYSCAYFEAGNEDIDAAQEAKLDYICRKLRLARGERLLDVGCGWGGLIQYAAERYGVTALGVTLSERQARVARERIARNGLGSCCEIRVTDYRDLDGEAPFDKVASVGMVEHVGRAQLPRYFSELWRLIRPGGLLLNHGIVEAPTASGVRHCARQLVWRDGQFIARYVFPDGELVPLGDVVTRAENAGFEVRDVESLREHYALTLRHWLNRLEWAHTEASRLVGPALYRTWRLYIGASAQAFTSGRISVAQVLLAKPDHLGRVGLPATRRDLYGYRCQAATAEQA